MKWLPGGSSRCQTVFESAAFEDPRWATCAGYETRCYPGDCATTRDLRYKMCFLLEKKQKKKLSLLIFFKHTCRFQTFPLGFYLHSAFEGVPSSTNGKRSYFPTSCFSTVQGLLKKGCNNRKRDDRYGEWVTKTKKRSSLHKGKHRTALWSQSSWGGHVQPARICCWRKKKGLMMARSRHSFKSGAQPTQEQIDPSWSEGMGRRRGAAPASERLINGPFSLCNLWFTFMLLHTRSNVAIKTQPF